MVISSFAIIDLMRDERMNKLIRKIEVNLHSGTVKQCAREKEVFMTLIKNCAILDSSDFYLIANIYQPFAISVVYINDNPVFCPWKNVHYIFVPSI